MKKKPPSAEHSNPATLFRGVHGETLEARILVLGGGDPTTLRSLVRWMVAQTRQCSTLRAAERRADAVNEWRKAVRRLENWSRENADVPKYREVLAAASNNLAWELAVSPDATVRNPQEAVTTARRAVDRTGSW